MSVSRPLPVVISVILAAGLWVYGVVLSQTAARPHSDARMRGGYATLVCGDTYSDREIRSRLDGRGLKGLVSESDQWFLLDCFGRVEKIPLVEYEDRLLPFDPRNDGYAEKLKSLFVRDGKRFVYIPLGTNNPESLEMKIAVALTGISYSLEYARGGAPLKRDILFPLIAVCLTFCPFLAIPALRRRLNAGLLPCLIALSPLALGLARGFALAALLAGLAALFAEPGKTSRFPGRRKAYDLPVSFTAKWPAAFAFIACYCVFSFFSGLPVLFAFLVPVSFCCVLAVSIRAAGGKFRIKLNVSGLYPRRRRFIPVEIIGRNTSGPGFFPVMVPFAVMAIVLAFAGLLPSSRYAEAPAATAPAVAPLPPGAITEDDFKEHYLFQSGFSLRTLGITREAGTLPPVIAGYALSPNGLLDPVAPGIGEELRIPDFPLGDLLRGLNRGPPSAAREVRRPNSTPFDFLFSLPPALFILSALIYSLLKKRQGKYDIRSALNLTRR